MSIIATLAVPHPPIILPEVGRGEEAKIAKTTEAFNTAMQRVAQLKPDTVVLISPHATTYSNYFHISPQSSATGNMSSFGAAQVQFSVLYDADFAKRLSQEAKIKSVDAGTEGEKSPKLDHGTMVPLYFLNKFYTDYKLVRIGQSGFSPLVHYHFGQAIAATAEALQRRTVIIASGDLSHKLKADGPYGFTAEGPEFDRQTVDAFASGSFLSLLTMDAELCDAAAECGLRSFWVMAGALDKKAVSSELLSYEGTFGVGYGVAFFEPTGDDPSRSFGEQWEQNQAAEAAKRKAGESLPVRLARLSIETYVKTGKRLDADNLPSGFLAQADTQADTQDAAQLSDKLMNRRAGVFVSLKKHGQLRGCIGTIAPTTDCIAQEILQNAVSAAANDHRFSPVTIEEIYQLVYSVDVLGETEAIDSPAQLDVKRYGVIVESRGRRGLLLPNLEGVDTVEQQIAISKQKAGIASHEKVNLSRFEVVRCT